MKIAIVGAALTSLVAIPAFADQPGPGWSSQPGLKRTVQKHGYHVTKVEADDGRWEGEMIRAGKLYEFHAYPRHRSADEDRVEARRSSLTEVKGGGRCPALIRTYLPQRRLRT